MKPRNVFRFENFVRCVQTLENDRVVRVCRRQVSGPSVLITRRVGERQRGEVEEHIYISEAVSVSKLQTDFLDVDCRAVNDGLPTNFVRDSQLWCTND